MPNQSSAYHPVPVTHCWRCGGRPAVVWVERDPYHSRAICLACREEYLVS
jgi:hypothetical protein